MSAQLQPGNAAAVRKRSRSSPPPSRRYHKASCSTSSVPAAAGNGVIHPTYTLGRFGLYPEPAIRHVVHRAYEASDATYVPGYRNVSPQHGSAGTANIMSLEDRSIARSTSVMTPPIGRECNTDFFAVGSGFKPIVLTYPSLEAMKRHLWAQTLEFVDSMSTQNPAAKQHALNSSEIIYQEGQRSQSTFCIPEIRICCVDPDGTPRSLERRQTRSKSFSGFAGGVTELRSTVLAPVLSATPTLVDVPQDPEETKTLIDPLDQAASASSRKLPTESLEPRSLYCMEHNKSFQTKKAYKRHLASSLHPESMKKYKCPQCDQEIVGRLDNLGRHISGAHHWTKLAIKEYLRPMRREEIGS